MKERASFAVTAAAILICSAKESKQIQGNLLINELAFYPLGFEPIFQYRLWGGRGLEDFMSTSLPGDGPIGEAWILSDRDDFSSRVSDGLLKGRTLTELVETYPKELMGSRAYGNPRFPLLLKFLDCVELLSVQVHPSDRQTELLPAGENGKTEAWVVLQASEKSKIFKGIHPGESPDLLREEIENRSVGTLLPSFTPVKGDAVYIPSGTVHTLGYGVMVFEVQENSDVTFRLYDWDRVDPKTGKRRDLQVEKGIAAVNFYQGIGKPVDPVLDKDHSSHRELLFQNDHFWTWRTVGGSSFKVGKADEPRVLICLEGSGEIEHKEATYPIKRGGVVLLPASVGECECVPTPSMSLLEIAIPEAK